MLFLLAAKNTPLRIAAAEDLYEDAKSAGSGPGQGTNFVGSNKGSDAEGEVSEGSKESKESKKIRPRAAST